MKAYKVISEVWHKGIQYIEGEVIHLTDAAAKYIKHAIEEVEAEVKAVAEKVVPAKKADPKVETASVSSKPQAPAAPAAPAATDGSAQ